MCYKHWLIYFSRQYVSNQSFTSAIINCLHITSNTPAVLDIIAGDMMLGNK